MALLSLPKTVLQRILRHAVEPTWDGHQVLHTSLTFYHLGAPLFFRELIIGSTDDITHFSTLFDLAAQSVLLGSRLPVLGPLVRDMTVYYLGRSSGTEWSYVPPMRDLVQHLTHLKRLETKSQKSEWLLHTLLPTAPRLTSLFIEAPEYIVNTFLASCRNLHTLAQGNRVSIFYGRDEVKGACMTDKMFKTLVHHHGPHLQHMSLRSVQVTQASFSSIAVFS